MVSSPPALALSTLKKWVVVLEDEEEESKGDEELNVEEEPKRKGEEAVATDPTPESRRLTIRMTATRSSGIGHTN